MKIASGSMHKAGFVNIVGNPNVGKSTLMNLLVGEHISIATFKAQTTRHRIMGIVNTEESQIVFSDTPGVLKPNYKLQESMLAFSESALVDADVLLYMTDVVEKADKNSEFLEKVAKMKVPVIVIINKIDLTDQENLIKLVEAWHEKLPNAEIIPISAANSFGVETVLKRVNELLPESPPYFDKDQLTDKPARFFVSEIVREKILLHYDKEIPYSVEVAVERLDEVRGGLVGEGRVGEQRAELRGERGEALGGVLRGARVVRRGGADVLPEVEQRRDERAGGDAGRRPEELDLVVRLELRQQQVRARLVGAGGAELLQARAKAGEVGARERAPGEEVRER